MKNAGPEGVFAVQDLHLLSEQGIAKPSSLCPIEIRAAQRHRNLSRIVDR